MENLITAIDCAIGLFYSQKLFDTVNQHISLDKIHFMVFVLQHMASLLVILQISYSQ